MEFFLLLSFRLGFSALVGWMGGHRKIGSFRVFALSLFFPLLALGVTAFSQYTPAFKQQMKVAAEARAVSRAERKITKKRARDKVLEQYMSEKEEKKAEKSKAVKKDGAEVSSGKKANNDAEKGSAKEVSSKAAEKESSKKGRGLMEGVRRAMSALGGLAVSAFSPELGDSVMNDFKNVVIPDSPPERFLDYMPMDDDLAAKVGFMVHGDNTRPSLSELIRPAFEDQGVEGYREMGKPALRNLARFRDLDSPCYSVFCDDKGLRLYRGRRELVRLSVHPGSPLLGVSMDSPVLNMDSAFEKAVFEKVTAKDYSGLVDVLSDVSAYLNRSNIDALSDMISGEKADIDSMYKQFEVSFVTGLDGKPYVVAPGNLSPVDMELFRKAVAEEPCFSDAEVVEYNNKDSKEVSLFQGVDVKGNGVGLQYSPDRYTWFYNPVEGAFVVPGDLPVAEDRGLYGRYRGFLESLSENCRLMVDGEPVNDVYVDGAVTISYNENYSDVCYVRYGADVVAAISFDPYSPEGVGVSFVPGFEDKDVALDPAGQETVKLYELINSARTFSDGRFLSVLRKEVEGLSADAAGLSGRVKEVRASVVTPEEPEEGYYQEQERSVGLGI